MSDLSEVEIFDVLISNLREAAVHCDRLATFPLKGLNYKKLRTNLGLIEGACRQMGYYRNDMRYQALGFHAAGCHKRAGDWLRSKAAPELFLKLADVMRKLERDINGLRHGRTGRSGPILVKPREAPHRDTRPVYVRKGSLVLPNTPAPLVLA